MHSYRLYMCHISNSFVFDASKDSLHNICVPSVFVFNWRKTSVAGVATYSASRRCFTTLQILSHC